MYGGQVVDYGVKLQLARAVASGCIVRAVLVGSTPLHVRVLQCRIGMLWLYLVCVGTFRSRCFYGPHMSAVVCWGQAATVQVK